LTKNDVALPIKAQSLWFSIVPASYSGLMWRPPRSKRNQTSQDEKIDTTIGVVFFVLMAMLVAMLVAFLYKRY